MTEGEFGNFGPKLGTIVRNDGWVDAQIEQHEGAVEYITGTNAIADR